MLKSWLNKLKAEFVLYLFPEEITRENVNNNIPHHSCYKITILALACAFDKRVEECEEFLSALLSLGAVITHDCFVDSRRYKFLLEAGADPNVCDATKRPLIIHCIATSQYDLCRLLIDYGANSPERGGYFPTYASISNHRVSECRQALLALLRACNQSSSPLRGMMIQIATQVWRMKGGDGCGARGHNWDIIA